MERYTGYKVIPADDPHLSDFYSHPDWNVYFNQINEYIIVLNAEGRPAGEYVWTGDRYERISYKPIDNGFSGKICPRNAQ